MTAPESRRTEPERPGPKRPAEASPRRWTPGAAALRAALPAALAIAAASLGALSCGSESGPAPTPGVGAAAPTTPSPPAPEPPPEPEPEPPAPPVLLGSPCYGISVSANAPRLVDDWNRATVVLDWDDAAFAEGFDWVSPHFDFAAESYDARTPPAALEMGVLGWETAPAAPTVTRHTLDLLWPPFREIGMRLRSAEDACPLSLVVCGAEGCELRP